MNSSRSHSQQVVKLGDQFTLGVCVEGGNGLALGDTRSREYLENSPLPTRGPEGASATPAVLDARALQCGDMLRSGLHITHLFSQSQTDSEGVDGCVCLLLWV